VDVHKGERTKLHSTFTESKIHIHINQVIDKTLLLIVWDKGRDHMTCSLNRLELNESICTLTNNRNHPKQSSESIASICNRFEPLDVGKAEFGRHEGCLEDEEKLSISLSLFGGNKDIIFSKMAIDFLRAVYYVPLGRHVI